VTTSPARLAPGDRVALLLPGSVRYVEVVLGLLAAEVVPVPLDPRLTAHERAGILDDVEPALVVEDPAVLDDLAAAFPVGLPRARPMHVTSGTTGRPKGVWSGILGVASAEALVAEERDLWGFAADDVNLVVSPLHHSAPLRFAMGTLLAGGRVVVPGPFDADVLTATIAAERPTTMFVVPTHLQRLFAHWDTTGGGPDLASFRLVAHAGAACPPDVKQRVVQAFPAGATWEFYGSTEGQFTACRSEEQLDRPGTVGRARPGRALEVDADGTIWCRVPEHARFAYWGAPEKTAAAWRGDAFTVGDLGRLDEDGYLYLDGRREDLVISGGVNVYPVEVEHVLAAHAGVREVAVFGVPDPDWGQRVCAAYVGDADEQELRVLAAENLVPPKRPKTYHRVDALPLTSTGKVKRLDLADRFGGVSPPR
jgi:long-chain acyl-CoA synthetase